MLTGMCLSAERFRNTKNRQFERVHARTATLTASFGGPKGHKKKKALQRATGVTLFFRPPHCQKFLIERSDAFHPDPSATPES